MNDLDPAVIMAEHHGEPDEWCYGDDDRPQMWPCDTYRLAAALVEAQEREQRVRAVLAAGPPIIGISRREIREALDGKP